MVYAPRSPAERLRDLLCDQVAPGLATAGFRRRHATLVAERPEVRWLLDVERAPWATADRLSFTIAWGVQVPGLDALVDDPAGRGTRAWRCPVHGRLGERAPGLEARWFTVRRHRGPFDQIRALVEAVDARTGHDVVASVAADVVPRLRRLDSVHAVQTALVATLDRSRRPPPPADLQCMRLVVALSLLQGERENASRWLAHLEARSSSLMAPHVVAERLADLRERCA